ncbi:isocitrate lyase/phosphoenolpyruvate mutase family protein, partial [Klebsiella variicola]|nr:isocitrate lyase/phosphoenolpyruvate mutase family protein [Klebsiella variicola]
STLSALGVKRISMGNFIHAATQARLKDLLCQVAVRRGKRRSTSATLFSITTPLTRAMSLSSRLRI